MRELVKAVVRADGQRRIEIYRRADGHFTFLIDELVYHYDSELREQLQDYGMVWASAEVGGIYETLDQAEREAGASCAWQREEK